MEYEDCVTDEAIELEQSHIEAVRPQGLQNLGFNQFSGPQFELLIYLLVKRHEADRGTLVELLPVSGDGGRDVAVYRSGRLLRIIQCKNLSKRVTRPGLVEEVLKIALNETFRTERRSNEVRYEIWAPEGLSGPAQRILQEWPTNWTEEAVRPEFEKVVTKYASFRDFTWEEQELWLLETFPSQIDPGCVGSENITDALHAEEDLRDRFFVFQSVMAREDVVEVLDSRFDRRQPEIVLEHQGNNTEYFRCSEFKRYKERRELGRRKLAEVHAHLDELQPSSNFERSIFRAIDLQDDILRTFGPQPWERLRRDSKLKKLASYQNAMNQWLEQVEHAAQGASHFGLVRLSFSNTGRSTATNVVVMLEALRNGVPVEFESGLPSTCDSDADLPRDPRDFDPHDRLHDDIAYVAQMVGAAKRIRIPPPPDPYEWNMSYERGMWIARVSRLSHNRVGVPLPELFVSWAQDLTIRCTVVCDEYSEPVFLELGLRG